MSDLSGNADSAARFRGFRIFQSLLGKLDEAVQYYWIRVVLKQCPLWNVRTMMITVLKNSIGGHLQDPATSLFNTHHALDLLSDVFTGCESERNDDTSDVCIVNYYHQAVTLLYFLLVTDTNDRLQLRGSPCFHHIRNNVLPRLPSTPIISYWVEAINDQVNLSSV